ncbi:MAG: hypothetical protein FJX18_06840 [Alphaproteobacteria bacterium]|nr:hypothetical protein [Alphaproteobacteria bacterium]
MLKKQRMFLAAFFLLLLPSSDSFCALRSICREFGEPLTKRFSHVISIRWMSSNEQLAKDLESLDRSYNPAKDNDSHPPKVSVDLHPAWDLAVSHTSFAKELGFVQSTTLTELGLKGIVKKKP